MLFQWRSKPGSGSDARLNVLTETLSWTMTRDLLFIYLFIVPGGQTEVEETVFKTTGEDNVWCSGNTLVQIYQRLIETKIQSVRLRFGRCKPQASS